MRSFELERRAGRVSRLGLSYVGDFTLLGTLPLLTEGEVTFFLSVDVLSARVLPFLVVTGFVEFVLEILPFRVSGLVLPGLVTAGLLSFRIFVGVTLIGLSADVFPIVRLFVRGADVLPVVRGPL